MKTATSCLGTIAYADDHDELRDGICNALRRANFEIIIAVADGRQLLKSLKKLDKRPVACIVDMFMSEMGGMEVIPEIRRRWPDMTIIACSASSISHSTEEVKKAGANGFWLKGTSIQKLIDLISYSSP
ncbi:response regulator [Mucilaginibacter sp. Mucisp86]|uniref:response regulator n=1 Tax=Mucilaginibacter sp. Mucisp86 TaxID=3243060 RepID=UPI0039B388A1